MKIAVFSDTHTAHWQVKVPDADILIFAGDMTCCRTNREVVDFNKFLRSLPHKYKVVVAGNHDHRLTDDPEKATALLSEAIYLQDETVVIEGITIYGAPWNPLFNDYACDAFALPRGTVLKEKWDMIPSDIDILVTHVPPSGILDRNGPVSHGCTDLAAIVAARKPKYHIFGHIHNRHGVVKYGETRFINCNVQGKGGVLRSPLLLDYETGEILEVEKEEV
ncbi:MAG: metallophosphatase domain-containing protein [Candidatus Electrothrix sp. GW3-4]|uniref:metallophosphoesterase family protein n=1 Tax=Candidatus Electrothrix sp. GW3-4 TaxID=3126740 RepID=UPI0030D02735